MRKLISIIIPAYNEEGNIPVIYRKIKEVFLLLNEYDREIIFVDDGSTDQSAGVIRRLADRDNTVSLIEFSRNFGKEMATSAGINSARGEAAIIIDADLQHPPELIPEFIKKWEAGAETVIGIRDKNEAESVIKAYGSNIFYKIMRLIGETEIIPRATDFRLIDRMVIDEFNKFTERGRITRGLIDWLGFKQEFISFKANKRLSGRPGYSTIKLCKLAFSTFISHSLVPLKLAGYLGIFIIITSGPFGLLILINRYIIKGSFGLSFSGPAMLAMLILFLIGIVLSCLGLIALYIGNIRAEVMNRPLYVIRKKPD